MLSGEAGIGKTRIAHELCIHAEATGTIHFSGCCFEGDWQPAYGPWVEAIGEYVRSSDPKKLKADLGPGIGPLARLVPQIRVIWPDTPETPPLSPDEERFRLYDAVVQFFLTVAQEKTILLVLDDLHWADRDSLRLLRHLARLAVRSRMLIVGAYRAQELEITASHPLADLLPVLKREADYQHIAVHGLAFDEVAAYLALNAGRPLPTALVQAIFDETGGNPFYVREVFRHLTEEGKILLRGGRWSTDLSIGELGIPEGVRQLIDRRLTRLSDETSRVLRQAAGFMGRFDFSMLQAVTDLPEDKLLDCIDESLRAGLLQAVDSPTPSYDFAHAIVRHTLREELNPDRRVRLHRRIAETMERVYAGREREHAAELAHQYLASAALPGASRGIGHALAAAEQARMAYAHSQAAAFLRMARDLAFESNAGDRAEILCKVALAEAEALMLEESCDSARAALAALSEAGAGPEERAAFISVVARALKAGGARPSVWKPLVERGIELLGGRRDLLWARLMLLRDAFEPVSVGPINVARWVGHDPRAIAMARASGDEVTAARLQGERLRLRRRHFHCHECRRPPGVAEAAKPWAFFG